MAALFENLEDDVTVHQFVEWFPGVTLDQARAVLDHAARSSLAIAQVRIRIRRVVQMVVEAVDAATPGACREVEVAGG